MLRFPVLIRSSRYMSSATDFLNYVNASPSPYHAVDETRKLLVAAGYKEWSERDHWNVKAGDKFFVTRNQSCITAFGVGGKWKPSNGFTIIGAHTDSPCLRVKKRSDKSDHGAIKVGAEKYGGGIWNTWFDRDLKLAGRALVRGKDGKVSHRLVHINKPILRVPNLCIHLNRGVNDGFAPNTETEMVPILAQAATYELNKIEKPAGIGSGTSVAGKHHPLFISLLENELGVQAKDILDVELCFADHQPGQIGGTFDEYIFAPRLDNLCCCFAAIKGLIDSTEQLEQDDMCRMVTLFDNEEVGSGSAAGACSSLMEYYLRRVASDPLNLTSFEESISRSYCISADMVHALHPNYPQKHESNHRPLLCQGVTIKTNSNQRYATTAVTASLFHQIADKAGITIQDVMVKNDSACGSTIGPITSAGLGMRVIDVGIPQLSMHSCREMMGTASIDQLTLLCKTFFEQFSQIDKITSVDL
jgi:aspartyl aminopeptidase